MQFSRARFLSSASTTYHGASGMSVWTNISSFAREYSTHFVREYRSVSGQLPSPHRVLDPRREPALLLLVAHREPILDEDDAVVHEQPLEDRALLQEPVVLGSGAEPEDVLDARAVVPTAVRNNTISPAAGSCSTYRWKYHCEV